jgi:hypothetical protein
MLAQIGAEPEAPCLSPAHDPPVRENCDAPQSEATGGRETDWDFVPKIASDDPFDQRID